MEKSVGFIAKKNKYKGKCKDQKQTAKVKKMFIVKTK